MRAAVVGNASWPVVPIAPGAGLCGRARFADLSWGIWVRRSAAVGRGCRFSVAVGGGECGLRWLVASCGRQWQVWVVVGGGVLSGVARWLVVARNLGLGVGLSGPLPGWQRWGRAVLDGRARGVWGMGSWALVVQQGTAGGPELGLRVSYRFWRRRLGGRGGQRCLLGLEPGIVWHGVTVLGCGSRGWVWSVGAPGLAVLGVAPGGWRRAGVRIRA